MSPARDRRVPTLVLGGSGYVSGELLRILSGHPTFELAAALSGSVGGQSIESVFPHLTGRFPGAVVEARETLESHLKPGGPIAVFSCGPHGESAAAIDRLLTLAEERGAEVRLVDLSADFRFDDVSIYQQLYDNHGAPHRIGEFHSSLPEHGPHRLRRHVGCPGCFTTSVVLPSVPVVQSGIVAPILRVSSVTGSTGSGKSPTARTHHPERSGNLYAYKPLGHRHEPEMGRLISLAVGSAVDVRFVPHSGPFARGIHTTVHADLLGRVTAEQVAEMIAEFYEDAPFVEVVDGMPQIREVAGTNRCRIGVAVSGRALVVTSVIDNLVKGAAGGAVQWMNRLFDRDDREGLVLGGLGWY
jgi:N-acetyl-gamma-glutamyl-phosphate reductase